MRELDKDLFWKLVMHINILKALKSPVQRNKFSVIQPSVPELHFDLGNFLSLVPSTCTLGTTHQWHIDWN